MRGLKREHEGLPRPSFKNLAVTLGRNLMKSKCLIDAKSINKVRVKFVCAYNDAKVMPNFI
jgi:hypothetical protein